MRSEPILNEVEPWSVEDLMIHVGIYLQHSYRNNHWVYKKKKTHKHTLKSKCAAGGIFEILNEHCHNYFAFYIQLPHIKSSGRFTLGPINSRQGNVHFCTFHTKTLMDYFWELQGPRVGWTEPSRLRTPDKDFLNLITIWWTSPQFPVIFNFSKMRFSSRDDRVEQIGTYSRIKSCNTRLIYLSCATGWNNLPQSM